MRRFDRVLVPVDFSSCARAAVDCAAVICARFDGWLDLLYVWPPAVHETWSPLGFGEDRLALFERSDAGARMKELLGSLDEPLGPHVQGRLEAGDPLGTILRVAGEGRYDLIVMGTHGRTGMSHLLVGSIAEAVVRRAPCPVLTVQVRPSGPRPERPTHDRHGDDLGDENPYQHAAGVR